MEETQLESWGDEQDGVDGSVSTKAEGIGIST